MPMTQLEAIELLETRILQHELSEKETCAGDWILCPNDECYICSVRDCPENEPLHYHHDGCPHCDIAERMENM